MTDLSSKKLGRQVLGRGLGALLPEQNTTEAETKISNSPYIMCPIELIEINTKQPRKHFDELEINALAESIRENGILQALLVRKKLDGKYELVAGERRLRAAKQIGLKEVPVVIKSFTDRQMLQVALVENIQRENLNAIEEAEAYKVLLEEYNMTQDTLAKAIGKNRSSIANYLRLLKLPADIKQGIAKNEISMGHARALCSLDNVEIQRALYKQTKDENLSVRALEDLVKKYLNKTESKILKTKLKQEKLSFSPVEKSLQDLFKTKVRIKGNETKGRFVIDYYSKTDFDRIISLLYGEKDE